MVIDEFEAVVVRSIYKWRHKGCSLRRISDLLEENKIAAPRKGAKWCPETIRKILKNEKYYGYVFLQKTYVPDYLDGRQRKNCGELEQYLVEHVIEPILK